MGVQVPLAAPFKPMQFTYTKADLGKNTFQFTVEVPWEEIKKTQDLVFIDLAKELETAGFRKGKVPLEIAKKEIRKETILQEAARRFVPEIYDELVRKINLKPIITPKVELVKEQENEKWEIRVMVCEKPLVKLGNYKDAVKNKNAEHKKVDIWTPDKKDEKKPEEKTEESGRKKVGAIFNTLLSVVEVPVSDMLILQELDKRLAQLVDDVRKIGLTMDAYLASKNETIESIRGRMRKEIEEMYALEFTLEAIAEDAHIVVDDKELSAVLEGIKDEKMREEARKNSYFYATLLRRQKTLDYLLTL